MFKLKNILPFLFISTFFLQNVNAQENEVIIIKASHVLKEKSPKGLALEEFKKRIESKFPDRVKMEVYHDNSLFKDREESEALEIGAVNIIVPTTGKIANSYKIKEFEIFDLPFLFKGVKDLQYFSTASSGMNLLNLFNKKHSHIMATGYWLNDFRNYIGYNFYKSPKDFKGKIARTESLKSMQEYVYDLYDVEKTLFLPFSALNKAMKKEGFNKVDVSSNPMGNIMSAKLYEKSNFLTISKHDVNSYVILMNKTWFAGLPTDIQKELLELSRDIGIYHWEMAQKVSKDSLIKLKEEKVNIYELTELEKTKFREMSESAYDFYRNSINELYLNEVLEDLKKFNSQ